MKKEKKNTLTILIVGSILLAISLVFLFSGQSVGQAISTLGVEKKNANQTYATLTNVTITNPYSDNDFFYYGVPITFTAHPSFNGPKTSMLPRYLCKWTLYSDHPTQQGQILNPYPIINECSVTVTPGANGVIMGDEMRIVVEVITSVDQVTTIKTDSKKFLLVSNPTPPKVIPENIK